MARDLAESGERHESAQAPLPAQRRLLSEPGDASPRSEPRL